MKKILFIAFLSWLLLFCTACTRKDAPIPTAIQTAPVFLETEPLAAPALEKETVPVTEPAMVPAAAMEPEAQSIEDGFSFFLDHADVTNTLSDNIYRTQVSVSSNQSLTVKSEQPFSALYIIWDKLPGTYTIAWDGGSVDRGADGFLHEYVRLPDAVTSAEFVFSEEETRKICDIGLYSAGSAPAGVQEWMPPCETADILVFPTHSDDDVLFFGGLISYYAIEEGLTVQTAFMVDHWYERERNHERLNGLWELGVRHYPILGMARDFMTKSLQEAMYFHRSDDILGWQIQQLRRFKPLVVVGHDLDGEYGHGQHMLNAYYLTQAVEAACDPEQYAESAQLYGTWDTPKLYLHLYETQEIVFDVNTPLENDPEGRTPFEIAEDAYEKHVSQQKYDFHVSQSDKDPAMDCRRFGLYRTLVGYDSTANLMENIDWTQWR